MSNPCVYITLGPTGSGKSKCSLAYIEQDLLSKGIEKAKVDSILEEMVFCLVDDLVENSPMFILGTRILISVYPEIIDDIKNIEKFFISSPEDIITENTDKIITLFNNSGFKEMLEDSNKLYFGIRKFNSTNCNIPKILEDLELILKKPNMEEKKQKFKEYLTFLQSNAVSKSNTGTNFDSENDKKFEDAIKKNKHVVMEIVGGKNTSWIVDFIHDTLKNKTPSSPRSSARSLIQKYDIVPCALYVDDSIGIFQKDFHDFERDLQSKTKSMSIQGIVSNLCRYKDKCKDFETNPKLGAPRLPSIIDSTGEDGNKNNYFKHYEKSLLEIYTKSKLTIDSCFKERTGTAIPTGILNRFEKWPIEKEDDCYENNSIAEYIVIGNNFTTDINYLKFNKTQETGSSFKQMAVTGSKKKSKSSRKKTKKAKKAKRKKKK